MTEPFKKYSKTLTIFTAIIGIICFISIHFIPKQYISAVWPLALLFFYVANLVALYYLLSAFNERINNFVNRFLVITFLKMLAYLVVLVTHVYFNRSDALHFTILFLIFYVLFTSFEVFILLKINKSGKLE